MAKPSLNLRPPPFCFFFNSICVQYPSGGAAKNGEGLRTLIMWCGLKVDGGGGGGGVVPDYKFVCNQSESEFLTGQA